MKMSLTTIILLISCLISKAQIPDPGEGRVKIGMFFFNAPDTVNMVVGDEKLFMELNYYIKNNFILRKDDTADVPKNKSWQQVDKTDSNVIVSKTLSFKVNTPTYIIDWQKKLVYTFYNNNSSVSRASLWDDRQEFVYKQFIKKQGLNVKVDTSNQRIVFICGLPCYEGRFLSML